MTKSFSNAYLESQVISATPLKLVHLAYEGAISAIIEARGHLAAQRIRPRSKAITKALMIVIELQRSLDYQNGGEVSIQLGRLYDYIARQLIEANFRQIEEPLNEAQRLLETLNEGWKQIAAQETRAETNFWQESEEAVPPRASYSF